MVSAMNCMQYVYRLVVFFIKTRRILHKNHVKFFFLFLNQELFYYAFRLFFVLHRPTSADLSLILPASVGFHIISSTI